MPIQKFPILKPNDLCSLSEDIASLWGFELRLPNSKDEFFFKVKEGRLELHKNNENQEFCIYVDFISGKMFHRRKFGGGRNQAIARAVGLKSHKSLKIIDATAGLGCDSFVLASLGCYVHMLERNPVIGALLCDGLSRAKSCVGIGKWVEDRMSFCFDDFCKDSMDHPFKPDVVYLDPMFPEKNKSARVKKELQIIQSVVGQCSDDNLLSTALSVARKRVVVKRSANAPYLDQKKPDEILKTPKNRFDLYLIR